MTYLITQTFVLLLIAALLGLILGWYLTRISAAGSQSSLQARLRSAESDASKLRGELDVAVTARGQAEAERSQFESELLSLKSADQSDAEAPANDERVAELQGELDACRDQLAAANSVLESTASAPAPAPASSGPIAKVSDAAARAAAAMDESDGDSAEPERLDAATHEADDLQKIKGIGPKIAGILHDLGILRFEQIAAWTPENIAWINEHLRFKGRIEREEWIPQAKALARQD